MTCPAHLSIYRNNRSQDDFIFNWVFILADELTSCWEFAKGKGKEGRLFACCSGIAYYSRMDSYSRRLAVLGSLVVLGHLVILGYLAVRGCLVSLYSAKHTT